MATSLIGPLLVESAFTAAPLPRPPQPTRATRIRSLPAAWTAGMSSAVRAETAATPPAVLRNCRRVVPEFLSGFMYCLSSNPAFCRDSWWVGGRRPSASAFAKNCSFSCLSPQVSGLLPGLLAPLIEIPEVDRSILISGRKDMAGRGELQTGEVRAIAVRIRVVMQ